MIGKEAPPGRASSQLVSADSCGVNRNRRWANPEKSGGAKSRGCGVDLTASSGTCYAGRTANRQNRGKPDDAKVGPSPRESHGNATPRVSPR